MQLFEYNLYTYAYIDISMVNYTQAYICILTYLYTY